MTLLVQRNKMELNKDNYQYNKLQLNKLYQKLKIIQVLLLKKFLNGNKLSLYKTWLNFIMLMKNNYKNLTLINFIKQVEVKKV
jgi:hypothetical protein